MLRTLWLLVFFSAAPLVAAGDDALESTLMALRLTDTAAVKQTLKDIRSLKGFPKSVEPLLPALVWLSEGEDLDLAIAAKDLSTEIGWPGHYCLPCLRQFAARQDAAYKLMGLSALAKIVWDDPEAMWILMDVCQKSKAQTFRAAFRVTQSVSVRSCPDRMQMETYNEKLKPFLGRFQTSISQATYKDRYLLKALAQCSDLVPELRNSAADAYKRLPPNSNSNAFQ